MPHIATEKVLRGLDDDSNQYFMAGRKNKITDVALSISGILASLAATVLAATHVLLWITAAVATVRACASIQKVVDVRGRSGWYIRHVALVRSLASALKYAKIPWRSLHATVANSKSKWNGNGLRLVVWG